MDILILMTAAICHDLDHPGYNNTYVCDVFPLGRANPELELPAEAPEPQSHLCGTQRPLWASVQGPGPPGARTPQDDHTLGGPGLRLLRAQAEP